MHDFTYLFYANHIQTFRTSDPGTLRPRNVEQHILVHPLPWMSHCVISAGSSQTHFLYATGATSRRFYMFFLLMFFFYSFFYKLRFNTSAYNAIVSQGIKYFVNTGLLGRRLADEHLHAWLCHLNEPCIWFYPRGYLWTCERAAIAFRCILLLWIWPLPSAKMGIFR